MTKYITRQQQMLVIEKLYRSNDSITSTNKFNEAYASKLGRVGIRSIPLNDFYRLLKQTSFLRIRIKTAIKKITGETITIY